VRVGEILVERRKLERRDLARALDDQKRLGKRVCSLLVERGELELDDASRALGEQKGVPSALARHLEQRDVELAHRISPELARARCVLPIGRAPNRDVIICARDPSAALAAELQALLRERVVLVIAPASRLEALIATVYDLAVAVEEFDVDLSTGPIVTIPPDPPPPPPAPDLLDPESMRFALTDLDDARVDKTPTQSGQFAAITPSTLPPRAKESQAAAGSPPAPAGPPKKSLAPLSATRDALANATTRDASTELALAFLATRWQLALVVAIRSNHAVGYRAHGVALPRMEEIAMPLDRPSIVSRAVQTRRIATVATSAQDDLSRMFARSGAPSAVPIVVGDAVVAVIVVGDPVAGAGDAAALADELTQLAAALGAAWSRITGRG
jgi:hypothetical protein